MATDIHWPANIPQGFDRDSFRTEPKGNTIRTKMSYGPSKVRRRYSAVPTNTRGSFHMTVAEKVIFEEFFNTTLKGGIDIFNFPNQLNIATKIEARFDLKSDDPPYTVTPRGETGDFIVEIRLEEV